jgi:hypothetical protein
MTALLSDITIKVSAPLSTDLLLLLLSLLVISFLSALLARCVQRT